MLWRMSSPIIARRVQLRGLTHPHLVIRLSPPTACLPMERLYPNFALSKKHVQGRRKNNRVESSHVPIRRRERKAQGFRSPGSAQRFLSTHAAVYNTFNTCRHLIFANSNRELRAAAFATWREAVGVAA